MGGDDTCDLLDDVLWASVNWWKLFPRCRGLLQEVLNPGPVAGESMGNEYLRCSEWARTSQNFSQEERSAWMVMSAPTECSLDHLTSEFLTEGCAHTHKSLVWPLYLFTYALWIENAGKALGQSRSIHDSMTCEATGKHKNVGIFQVSTRPRRLIAPLDKVGRIGNRDGNFVIVNQFFGVFF